MFVLFNQKFSERTTSILNVIHSCSNLLLCEATSVCLLHILYECCSVSTQSPSEQLMDVIYCFCIFFMLQVCLNLLLLSHRNVVEGLRLNMNSLQSKENCSALLLFITKNRFNWLKRLREKGENLLPLCFLCWVEQLQPTGRTRSSPLFSWVNSRTLGV